METVRTFVAAVYEALLVAGHAMQDAELEQRAAHRDQLPPFVLSLEREAEAEGGQRRVRGEGEQPVAEHAQRDLRVSALQHRAGQTQQHVAAALVAGQPACGIVHIGRTLVHARRIAFDMQGPAGLADEPFAQRIGVAAHSGELRVCRRHQRGHQQGAHRGGELLALMESLLLADRGAVGCHQGACVALIVMRWSRPAKMPASVTTSARVCASSGSRRTRSRPSPV